ncbi:MAG TPA: hypothetical protein DCQ43_03685 [Treponema sp.]|nr:hypothetical protein [Treponema sp.]
MNRNRFCKWINSFICGTFVVLTFTGCFFDFIEGSGAQILDCQAVAGDGIAVVSWTMRGSSDVQLDAYVDGQRVFGDTVSAGKTNQFAYGLTNGIEYTFVVSNGTSEKSVSVTPSLEAGAQNTCEVNASTDYAFEIPASKTFVLLRGAQGKTVEFANINTTDQVLSSTYARVLVNAAVTDGTNVDPFEGALLHPEVAEINANRYSSRSVMVTPKEDVSSVRHFVEPTSVSIDASSRFGANSDDNFDISEIEKDLEGGSLNQFLINSGEYHKYVWLDANVSMDRYSYKKVTLRAVGTNNNQIKCLVWVEDSCYQSSEIAASGKMVTQKLAQELANTFAQHCDSERAVFGDEKEKFIEGGGSNGKNLNDPDYGSDTKDYVNIVIYDIGADYNNKVQQCNVAGYFFSKDYLSEGNYNGVDTYASKLANISNHGKYFYIDAPFCNYVSKDNYTGNNNKVSETIISTLFHEFQHMINFGQKVGDAPSWYNEMLSMLAEDMMRQQLGLNESVRKERLPAFNKYYWMSGATEYLEGENTVISYSTAYAFGAWLARTYGGVELVSKISRNQSVGLESIRDAIREQTGQTLTADELLKQYIQACVFRTGFASTTGHQLPTFYKDGTTSIGSCSLTKINLFGEAYKYNPYTNSSVSYYGPLLFTSTQKLAVRPTGFVLHSIGTVSTNEDVMLFFSPQMYSDANANQLVLYVQNQFSNKLVDELSED